MAGILMVAAETGNINRLYASIKVDPKVLDDIDAKPFVDTPLHIAASAGHTDFALEILSLKPSLGRKLNPDGLSSLHLALKNYQFETVNRLINFDKKLIRVKGREGATSLHLIAERDNNANQQRVAHRINILAEFLFACPNSVEDLTTRNETALHIAVRTENQRAVQVILGCICKIGRKEVLAYKDEGGNNALDMAVATAQLEIVRSLRSAGALESSAPGRSLAEFLSSPERRWEVLFKLRILVNRSVSMELRNIALVVAVLIATATFTAVLSPPGGVGGPGDNNLLKNGSTINATVWSAKNLFAANTSFMNATFFIPSTDDPVKRLIFKYGHGQATYGDFFRAFYGYNTAAFVLSMLMIMFVLPFRPFFLLHGALVFFVLSYGISFSVISPSNGSSEYFQIVAIVCASLLYLFKGVIYETTLLGMAVNERLRMLERLMNNVGQ